jgi:hypothetical protein
VGEGEGAGGKEMEAIEATKIITLQMADRYGARSRAATVRGGSVRPNGRSKRWSCCSRSLTPSIPLLTVQKQPLSHSGLSDFLKKKPRAFRLARAKPAEPKARSGPEIWARLGAPSPRAELNSGRTWKRSGRAKNLARTTSLNCAFLTL